MTIELGQGTPPSAAIGKLEDKHERCLAAIRKLHLRHKGMIKARVVKLFYKDLFSPQDINDLWMEWRRLHPAGEMP